jgi:hypothetical protein
VLSGNNILDSLVRGCAFTFTGVVFGFEGVLEPADLAGCDSCDGADALTFPALVN